MQEKTTKHAHRLRFQVVVLANRSLELLSCEQFRACDHRVVGIGAPRLSVAYEVTSALTSSSHVARAM
eukprot:5237003-Pleurochrysis_carterae.AAC.4